MTYLGVPLISKKMGFMIVTKHKYSNERQRLAYTISKLRRKVVASDSNPS